MTNVLSISLSSATFSHNTVEKKPQAIYHVQAKIFSDNEPASISFSYACYSDVFADKLFSFYQSFAHKFKNECPSLKFYLASYADTIEVFDETTNTKHILPNFLDFLSNYNEDTRDYQAFVYTTQSDRYHLSSRKHKALLSDILAYKREAKKACKEEAAGVSQYLAQMLNQNDPQKTIDYLVKAAKIRIANIVEAFESFKGIKEVKLETFSQSSYVVLELCLAKANKTQSSFENELRNELRSFSNWHVRLNDLDRLTLTSMKQEKR